MLHGLVVAMPSSLRSAGHDPQGGASMWWLAIPGAFLGAWLFGKYKEHHADIQPTGLARVRADAQLLQDLSAASYLKHLAKVAHAASVLEVSKPAAIAGDAEALMAMPGLFEAMHDLAAPFDVLTLQRNLNVLGASPPLHENGALDRATKLAVASLQKKFGQHPDGDVDSDLRFAVAYSVGLIYAQDLAPLCSSGGPR